MSVTYTALGGLQRAQDLLDRTASRLARWPSFTTNPQDQISLSDEAVNLIQAHNSYSANLDSLKVADEMQKSTLSLIA